MSQTMSETTTTASAAGSGTAGAADQSPTPADSPQLSTRPLTAQDAPLLHRWLTHPQAAYWQMGHHTPEQTEEYVEAVIGASTEDGWMIEDQDGRPVGYVETYDPSQVLLSEVFDAEPGDRGMHLLAAPAPADPQLRRPGLTSALMRAAVGICMERGARRIVVEPDVSNTAVHAKNAEVGFEVLREVDLPGKRALLSLLDLTRPAASAPAISAPVPHLRPEHMQPAQRHLVAKALAEFSHERLISPERETSPAQQEDGGWVLRVPAGSVYRFRAVRGALRHWAVEESTLSRTDAQGLSAQLDLQELVIELQEALGVPDRLLGTYLEELASTLASAAYKQHRGGPRADQLAAGLSAGAAEDFQRTEAAMTEGHPCFVATNGRIGFGLDEYLRYAPEAGRSIRYVWLAAHRSGAQLHLGEGVDAAAHWEQELGVGTLELLHERIRQAGADPEDYLLMPVHPWQFQHRIAVSFAPELACGDLIALGEAGDEYQPQQSIRTTFNRSRPEASYVKTALSIQNMGFLRGQSPAFMEHAPVISDWVAQTVRGDEVLRGLGFDVLREHAAVGYTGDAYHRTEVRSDQQKMLSVLWRESPLPRLAEGERAMTMAALLHLDHRGGSVAAELIRASEVDAETWLAEYLRAYLVPLIHCLEVHQLAFMPHGENIILRVRQGRVTGAFMKDLGEEIAVFDGSMLPQSLQNIGRIVEQADPNQSVYTDVFVGFFRHLASILHRDGILAEDRFWAVTAQEIRAYEELQLPEGTQRARRLGLREPQSFEQSCHNRLQLRNTLEMVSLEDTAGSLLYVGDLENPVAEA